MNASTANKILLLSVLLFTTSLITPVFSYDGDPGVHENFPGSVPLLIGLLPALFGLIGLPQGQFEFIGTISWLANPLLLTGWIGIYKKSWHTGLDGRMPSISINGQTLSALMQALYLDIYQLPKLTLA